MQCPLLLGVDSSRAVGETNAPRRRHVVLDEGPEKEKEGPNLSKSGLEIAAGRGCPFCLSGDSALLMKVPGAELNVVQRNDSAGCPAVESKSSVLHPKGHLDQLTSIWKEH